MLPNEFTAMASNYLIRWLELIRQWPIPKQTDNTSDMFNTEIPTVNDSPPSNKFLRELYYHEKVALRYEDSDLLDKALDCIPLQRIYDKQENDDDMVCLLLHWFKNEFFTWVDEPPCHQCNSKTRNVGQARPSQHDLAYGAQVVELYECTSCHANTRFPRYNDPGKLLETRRGRCGEWANCFTLCCRAIALEARIVLDKTDHLWTEIFSESQQRWIHCDPCEDAFDRPLLYSLGWNKKLSYCIAFSANEVTDVTRRYTRGWQNVLSRRTLVSELELSNFLQNRCHILQTNLEQNKKECLSRRKIKENEELLQASQRVFVKEEEMMGRQSGSLTWRTERGECKVGTTDMKKYQQGIEHKFKSGNFNLCGSATRLDDQIIRLTQTKTSQCGASHFKEPLDMQALRAVQIEFSIRITNENNGPAWGGADGMAFLIQSTSPNVLGEGGCSLGYGGLQESLAIEFDTYQSSDRCADPSNNHISVQGRLPPYPNTAHHDYSIGHTSLVPAMSSGRWIYVQVRLLVEDNSVEVALKEDEGHTFLNVLKVNAPVLDYLGNRKFSWIGMTASTGGIFQNQDIRWHKMVQWNKESQ